MPKHVTSILLSVQSFSINGFCYAWTQNTVNVPKLQAFNLLNGNFFIPLTTYGINTLSRCVLLPFCLLHWRSSTSVAKLRAHKTTKIFLTYIAYTKLTFSCSVLRRNVDETKDGNRKRGRTLTMCPIKGFFFVQK
jgi:hypothetical protein